VANAIPCGFDRSFGGALAAEGAVLELGEGNWLDGLRSDCMPGGKKRKELGTAWRIGRGDRFPLVALPRVVDDEANDRPA